MRFCLLLWCCEIDVFFVAAIKMDLPPQQAVIFSEAEIQTALKMYLATTLVRLWTDDYTLETIQDMDGMCLRKQSLQSALSGLVQCDFLQRNKKTNAYSLSSTIRNVASMGCVAQPQKQQQPLFPSTLILERLYLYLQSRTKGLAGKDDTWSEASMQDEDWPNMCLRKKSITRCWICYANKDASFKRGPLFIPCARQHKLLLNSQKKSRARLATFAILVSLHHKLLLSLRRPLFCHRLLFRDKKQFKEKCPQAR